MREPLDFDLGRIVVGTAGLAGIWGKVDRADSIRALHMALDTGINHIDTAPAYADAETLVSDAIKTWPGKKPFISTKAGKGRSDGPDIPVNAYDPHSIRRSVANSLRLFQSEAIDLLFLHDPTGMQPEEMEAAVDTFSALCAEGLIRQAGIGGNFGLTFEPWATNPPFTHFMGYNKYNLLRQTAAMEEYPVLRDKGFQIWQASPLYMGLLGAKYQEYMSNHPEWIPASDLDRAGRVKAFCMHHGIDMTSLALQYVYQSPWVDRMVIGASTSGEMTKTLACLQDQESARLALRLHTGDLAI